MVNMNHPKSIFIGKQYLQKHDLHRPHSISGHEASEEPQNSLESSEPILLCRVKVVTYIIPCAHFKYSIISCVALKLGFLPHFFTCLNMSASNARQFSFS